MYYFIKNAEGLKNDPLIGNDHLLEKNTKMPVSSLTAQFGSYKLSMIENLSTGKMFLFLTFQTESLYSLSSFPDLTLIDWGWSNHVAVALDNEVYLWNATNGTIDCLLGLEEEDDYVTCVSWVQQGNVLAVGLSNRSVQVQICLNILV